MRRPQSSSNSGSNRDSNSNDDPISVFAGTIAKLPPDEWRAKTVAMEYLVNELSVELDLEKAQLDDAEDVSLSTKSRPQSLRSSTNSNSHNSNRSSSTSTSNAPKSILHPTTLRNLSYPFCTLLSDLRALVVKAACSTLATLSEMLQNRMSLLLKDLLPSILALHAQTAKVMQGYAQSAMETILSSTKNSRPVIATLVAEVRANKSKDVRSVCVVYLDCILAHWPKAFFMGGLTSGGGSRPSKSNGKSSNKESPLYIIIGHQLVKSISDPSQQVRIQARQTFMTTFRRKFPTQFNVIINDRNGPLSKDSRLKRSIMTQAKQEASMFEERDDEESDNEDSHNSMASPKPIGIPRASTASTASSSSKSINMSRNHRTFNPSSSISSSVTTNATSPPSPSKSSFPSSLYSSEVTSVINPFSSAFNLSPKQTSPHESTSTATKNMVDDSHIIQLQNKLRVQSQLKNDSASLIQAAVRGMLTRKHILVFLEEQLERELLQVNDKLEVYGSPDRVTNTADDRNNDTHLAVSSPEMAMLKEARRALANHLSPGKGGKSDIGANESFIANTSRTSLLGMTAKEMATRRKTAGKIDVLPLPPSPSVDADKSFDESDVDTSLEMETNQTLSAEHYLAQFTNQRESMLFTPNHSMTDNSQFHMKTHSRRPRAMRQSSLKLKNRLSHQISNISETTNFSATSEEVEPSQELNSIGKDILTAHKQHIDEIMEILKEEMLIVKDFERKLKTNKFGEDDILGYFEGIEACLDQRAQVGDTLRNAMEEISQG